jgi:sugar/nucleoside kinase (ribokinase family)
MSEVVTFGEVMAMFVAAAPGPLDQVDDFRVRLAGAEMNVAVGLSRLGHRVRYLGAVGHDPLGVRIRRTLGDEGVDVSGMAVDAATPTGLQLKNRVRSGDPTVVYFRRGSAASRLRWSPEAERSVAGARHLHVTGVFPALAPATLDFTRRAMDTARENSVPVTFDPNLRPVLWPDRRRMVDVVNDLAVRADCVLPGLGEGELLTGRRGADDVAGFYLERGVRQVLVKLGADGAELHTADGCLRAPASPVETVDTVGAGDGFAAGWISGRLDGVAVEWALRRACAVGAAATTSEGDMDGLPTRTRLMHLLGHEPAKDTKDTKDTK